MWPWLSVCGVMDFHSSCSWSEMRKSLLSGDRPLPHASANEPSEPKRGLFLIQRRELGSSGTGWRYLC